MAATGICCFCGGPLSADGGVALTLASARARDEVQGLVAHGSCLAARAHPSVPLHPDIPGDGFGAEVLEAATALLGLPDAPGTVVERKDALRAVLDRLAVVYDSVKRVVLREEDSPEPTRIDYDAVRTRFAAAFPDLGLYDAVTELSKSDRAPEVTAGDALDDLADIAVDLQEVLDRAKFSTDDAVWTFRFGFETHWGTHLRWLQLYLHATRSLPHGLSPIDELLPHNWTPPRPDPSA